MNSLRQTETSELVREAFLASLSTAVPGNDAGADHLAEEASLRADLVENGWWGVCVPEEAGGQDLDYRSLAAIADAMGEACTRLPFLETAVLPALLLRAGSSSAGADHILRGLAEGRIRLAVAWQERLGDIAPTYARTACTLRNGRLSGSKIFALGHVPDAQLLVIAQDVDGGLTMVMVDPDAEGVELSGRRRIDGGVEYDVTFSDIVINPDLLISIDEESASSVVDACRILISVFLVSIARQATVMTRDYLLVREQFGRLIGANQAPQHRLVDLGIRIRLIEALIDEALDQLDGNAARPQALAASIKAQASEVAVRACEAAVQLHGAMGYTEEGGVGRYLKMALYRAPWLGSPADLRRRYLAFGGAFRND